MNTRPPVVKSSRSRKFPVVYFSAIVFVFCPLAILPQQSFAQQAEPTSCTAEGYLRIAVYPVSARGKTPVSVVLTDPQGRKLGYDPIRKTEHSDVPQSTFTGDTGKPKAPPKPAANPVDPELILDTPPPPPPPPAPAAPTPAVLELCNPIGGQYQLQVIGMEPGKYGVSINAANREVLDISGRPMSLDSRAEIPTTSSRRGGVQNFLIVYSRTPGVRVRVKPSP
ncbi:MAG: hypothetical protein JWO20_2696 [Candidatus Angelobacter sp.]|nr:hypothetical protein [Candidatus Angelobacter sp.]